MSDDTRNVLDLLFRTRAIVDRHEWSARRHGSLFNVFDILDRSTDEVKCHSAFIAELLDPRGSHGQLNLFLNLFLNHHDDSGDPILPLSKRESDTSTWSVETEKAFCQGRIDIVVEGENDVLIIENKIYAEDQPAQLKRYWDYASHLGKKVQLFYLTLKGEEPSSCSPDTSGPEKVRLLSYERDIDDWLGECLRAAALLPSLRETIVQYRSLIQRLATGTFNKEMIMQIAVELKSEEDLRAAWHIERALPEAKARVQMAFWDQLTSELEEPFRLKESAVSYRRSEIEKAVEACYTPSRGERHFGISFPLCQLASGRRLAFVIEVEWNLYYGIVLVDERGEEVIDVDEQKLVADKLREAGLELKQTKRLIIWEYPKQRLRLSFRKFGEECVALANDEKLRCHVTDLVEEIADFVGRLPEDYRTFIGAN